MAGSVAAAGGLAYLGTHDPHVAGSYPQCVLYSLTGIYCPACGGTRAAYDLLHGDVAGAMARNPAVPVLLVGVLLFLAYRVTYRRRHGTAAPAVPAWVPGRHRGRDAGLRGAAQHPGLGLVVPGLSRLSDDAGARPRRG